ncbi:MAG TPA: hypothetical protein VE968_09045 [Sphingomicrobium sp.]|nr:hypothetical protein [Sphingomicrobium sp.]
MPSSPGYQRDYKREAATAKARGEQGTGHDSGSAVRHRARREAISLGMIKADSPLDIDHKKPLVKGGAGTAKSNLRPRTPHANRSYHRNAHAGMI